MDSVRANANGITTRFMITIHAKWEASSLCIWGESAAADASESNASVQRPFIPSREFSLSADELRLVLGDVWDSLLISGAANMRFVICLPGMGDGIAPSRKGRMPVADITGLEWVPCPVDALQLGPADALDLLTAPPAPGRNDIVLGDSFTYWAGLGRLVLALLARQRFVPAVHSRNGGGHFGFWRAVIDDEHTATLVKTLIRAMPPVCRATSDRGRYLDATDVVEDFLWRSVDAMVRRCLEGDELAKVLQDDAKAGEAPQVRWLRSLVDADATLTGSAEVRNAIRDTVDTWLTRLAPSSQTRAFRTCFRLECREPVACVSTDDGADDQTRWVLSLHAQSTKDKSQVVEAASLKEDLVAPPILDRPFANAIELIRADAARAARHFPPIEPCGGVDGPTHVFLDLEQAYRFLRDAAPLLQAEDFGVIVPDWWHQERPRLRTRLNIRPAQGQDFAVGSRLGLEALVEYNWTLALDEEDLSLEEVSRLADAKAPLVCVRGRWAELPSSDLHTAVSFLQRQGGGRMTVFEALRLSYTADDLDTGLPVAGLRAQGWIKNLLNATLTHDQVESFDEPATFHGSLRPYQLHGLRWLDFLARHGLGACLADDMGLGKTIQLIALLLHEQKARARLGPTLLVVPMSLVGNWERELARFGPTLKVLIHHGLDRLTGDAFDAEAKRSDVVISTYGLTHRDREHLEKVDWYRIALDEAQNIKNPAAKQAVAVRAIPCVHRVALTGTPVENRLSELWSIMEFLNPGYLGSAGEFRKRFAVPIERYHDKDRGERLRHLIRPFVLRRLKDDPTVSVDLPEKMEMTVYCNLTREQAALYEATVTEMLAQIDATGGMQRRGLILATLVKLKQICNHPTQFLADNGLLSHRSGKLDRLTEMLDEVIAEKHRALVFTQFRKMGDLLHRHLGETFGDTVLFMHGGTPQRRRVDMVDQFQSEAENARVFLLSLKTGGVGLNLTAANHVFHFDRWWNPAVEDQATDRAHRIGQGKSVQVHKFVCLGTLEERIDAVSEEKRVLARNVIGSGDEWITELSTEALRDLFALSREAVAEE